LTTANILVEGSTLTKYKLKITDFGLGKVSKEKAEAETFQLRWASIEVLQKGVGKLKYWFFQEFEKASDVWQFGVVVWEILTGAKYTPFHELTTRDALKDHLLAAKCCTLLHQLGDCQLKHLSTISQKLSPILKECWDFDPKKRPDFINVHNKITAISSVERQELFPNPANSSYVFVGDKSIPDVVATNESKSLEVSSSDVVPYIIVTKNPYITVPPQQQVKESKTEI
jgi:serine/threonine protein kinase